MGDGVAYVGNMRVEWRRGMGGTTFNLFESLRSKGKSWILQSNKLNLLRLVRMLLQLFLNVLFFFSLSVSESVCSSPLLTSNPKKEKQGVENHKLPPKLQICYRSFDLAAFYTRRPF